MVRRTIVSLACLLVAACGGTQDVYAPRQPHLARDGGIYPRTPVPPNGEVRIASQGVRRISSSEGAQVDALLVRMTVTNDGERPWSIDTRVQFMQLPTGFRARPLLVRSPGAVGPVLDVGCRDRRVVDLYYVLPPAGLASLPSFDLLWQIRAGDRVISRRTELQRVRVAQLVDGTAGQEAVVAWGYTPERPVVVLRDSPALISQRQLRPDELR